MKTSVRLFLRASAVAAVVALSVHATRAQTPLRTPRESPKASVMMTVGVTDVSVTYSRPGVKGRQIWGDPPAGSPSGEATLDNGQTRPKDAVIVPYGHVWRAGANEATVFKVTDDVLVQGQPLPAGSYSLHMIPGRGEWTIIFNKDDGQWGSFQYDARKDALRVKTKPETTADAREWLAYEIEPTGPSAARVNIRWERLRVPFTVEVKDVTNLVLAKARAAMAERPDDWQVRLQAFNFANAQKVNQDEAARWLEESIRIKETFNNLSAKARWLAAQGKRAEAAATGERALQVGRVSNAPAQALADLEKRVSEWKGGN